MLTDKPFIYLRGVCKAYAAADGSSVKVLDGLDFEAEPGQFVAIRGESGSGKSTLLRILGLVDNNYTGEYFLGGSPIRQDGAAMPRTDQEALRADTIGFIFQEDRLLEHLDVQDNIELPLRIRSSRNQRQVAKLRELIESIYRPKEIGEGKILSRKRSKLSGGQRQRASILRALAHSPLLLLADEPTASLDKELKAEIFDTLSLLARGGKTVIVVSHDEIFERADLVYELRNGKLFKSAGSPLTAQGGMNATPAPHSPKEEFLAVSAAEPPSASLFARMRRLGRTLLPRTPLTLQISLAVRDLFRGWLFTLLALGALATGAFQLTLLWSLEAGTRELLDDLIRKGSRLNRITVPVKPENLTAPQRFPDRAQIAEIAGVTQVVSRREGIYRVQDRMGRDRFETIFGLETKDPELEKLLFSAGSGFSSEEALEVIMSERSIQRLFEVPGEVVSDQFRKGLIGQQIWFAVARPPAGTTLETMSEDVPLEVLPFRMTLVGIVAQAEADRNFYFPRTTQLLFERWRLDERRTFVLPLNNEHDRWTVPSARLREWTGFPWEERLHVYFADLDLVIPGHQKLTARGYESRAEIFSYQWVIHTRKLAHIVVNGLVILVLLVAGLVIAGNIMIGVQMRLKEIVLLKLLGMRDLDITMIYIWNAIMAAVIGTLIGFGAGVAMIHYLTGFIRENYPGAEFARLLGAPGPFFGEAVAVGLAIALVFSVVPAFRAGRTDPVQGFGV